MNITDTFRSYVNRMKLRRDLTGIDKVPLKFKLRRDEFNSKSKDVVYHISKLRDCLSNHKEQYMNIDQAMWLGPCMDDSQREKIDSAARNIIKNCSSLLKELAAFVEKHSLSSQLYQHRRGVLEIVANYLKSVCKLYADMRDCYARRQSKYNSMMKVAYSADPEKDGHRNQRAKNDERRTSRGQEPDEGVNTNANSVIEELTEEEVQMFEVENEDLINELNNLKGEVKAIEMKVTHIAGLQGTFAEMVMQQDLDIQRIDTKLIGATENVQDANLQLRKAVQNNASFRFYLLFFIMMLSFTLLFLNWYND